MNNTTQNDMIFSDGVQWQDRTDNQPEVFVGRLSFNLKRFIAWAEQYVKENGYINIKMMKSKKDGGKYFILDTFVPNTQSGGLQGVGTTPKKAESTEAIDSIDYPEDEVDPNDIPF